MKLAGGKKEKVSGERQIRIKGPWLEEVVVQILDRSSVFS